MHTSITRTRVTILLAALPAFICAPAQAAPETIKLPAELAAFVPAGYFPIGQVSADLNRDGTPDHLLVVQNKKDEDGARALLIITRGKDGTLKLAARNDKAVFCEKCGGMMGDPYQDPEAAAGRFTVGNNGGSAWRWSTQFGFAWSRRDEAWQLIRVESDSFHTSAPEKAKKTVHTPPKNFGKIDFADFDPDKYQGVGPK